MSLCITSLISLGCVEDSTVNTKTTINTDSVEVYDISTANNAFAFDMYSMIKNGDEQILNIFSNDDIIAEIVAFDKGNYPASAVTMTDTKVIVFDQSKLESLILKHPSIGVKLLREMSGRLRRAQQNVRDLALKDSSARVAGLLIFLAEKYGKKKKDKVVLDISLTQQELACMIGSSRETVSRVLGQFESEGLIKTSRKKINIYQPEKIKNYT